LQWAANRLDAERAELEAVLASGILGRTNYVVRFLAFVCEKYFDGKAEDVKEYSIAVNALGRAATFDPQADTIVRVTAHSLRKRLEEYYRTEGADHPIQISLPAGHYVPSFIHKNGQAANGANGNGKAPHGDAPAHLDIAETPDPALIRAANAPAVAAGKPSNVATIGAVLAVAACVALAVLYWWPRPGTNSSGSIEAAPAPMVEAGPSIRAVIGQGRHAYADQAGFVWSPDNFCSGGDSFSVSKPAIRGTGDPTLFEGGRVGVFHCAFPLPPGSYEMHLLFAETSDVQENARSIGYSVDGGDTQNLDVVDDSGADDTATSKIITGVHPESDGSIHLDFTAPHSFVNAVEIVPEPDQRPLPIRILAGRDTAYRDLEGRVWLPDRDFSAGRSSNHGSEVRNLRDSGIYDGQRLGHFYYSIPVARGNNYTLKLYFIERWFGSQNQNVGGVGSRVFDVSCNGTQLLKNFDITLEAQNAPLIKTFPHIQPTPQSKIEIYFTPNVNYPSISAIEVLPE
jgi:hypothetical protein